MMRKRFLSFMAAACLMGAFTACNDDDNASDFNALSRTYEGKSIELKMGEVAIPNSGKSVVLNAAAADKAQLTLNNILPENSSLTVDATLASADDTYTFTGEGTVSDGRVTVNGTVKAGLLSLSYQRKVTHPVAGTWQLASGATTVTAEIATGIPQIDAMAPMVGPLLGNLIAQKVSTVTLTLTESGIFGVAWQRIDATEPVNINPYTQMFSVQYCVKEGVYYLCIDKNYVAVLGQVLAQFAGDKMAELGIDFEQIVALFTDLGGYYGLALNMEVTNNQALFTADKSLLLPVINALYPLIAQQVPEAYKPLVAQLMQVLPNAKTLNLGLRFTR
ncbi:MAG: DUF4925 domain-containing protein [Parabacteroides sp.]